MCLTLIMFCTGFSIPFPLCFPFKILIVYLLWPFFLQLHFMLIFTSLLRLILSLIFRDTSLKSQGLSVLFSSHFNGLFCLIFSVELSFLVIFLFRWFMHLFFRHVSFVIQWIFICLTFLLSYPIRIRLFIRIFIFGFIRI